MSIAYFQVTGQSSTIAVINGVFFIILAIILFITEVVTPHYGALTVLGLAALLAGAFLLLGDGPAFLLISPWIVGGILVLFLLYLWFAISRSIKVHKMQPVTGKEGIKGKTATVKTTLSPEGTVFYDGSLLDSHCG